MKDRKENEKLFRLLDFLHEEEATDTAVLRKSLENSGVDLNRIEGKVAAMLKEADRALRRKKLDNANEERARFSDSLKDVAKSFFGFGSRKELMDAILSGRFGSTAQGRLQVQFRNRNPEELSDNDLKALLEDQQILELLEKSSGGKE